MTDSLPYDSSLSSYRTSALLQDAGAPTSTRAPIFGTDREFPEGRPTPKHESMRHPFLTEELLQRDTWTQPKSVSPDGRYFSAVCDPLSPVSLSPSRANSVVFDLHLAQERLLTGQYLPGLDTHAFLDDDAAMSCEDGCRSMDCGTAGVIESAGMDYPPRSDRPALSLSALPRESVSHEDGHPAAQDELAAAAHFPYAHNLFSVPPAENNFDVSLPAPSYLTSPPTEETGQHIGHAYGYDSSMFSMDLVNAVTTAALSSTFPEFPYGLKGENALPSQLFGNGDNTLSGYGGTPRNDNWFRPNQSAITDRPHVELDGYSEQQPQDVYPRTDLAVQDFHSGPGLSGNFGNLKSPSQLSDAAADGLSIRRRDSCSHSAAAVAAAVVGVEVDSIFRTHSEHADSDCKNDESDRDTDGEGCEADFELLPDDDPVQLPIVPGEDDAANGCASEKRSTARTGSAPQVE
ncbi:hypothetical protein DFJ73DRAFT_354309 [Zopfochytrium polystomum]|nr:hypothetical protein DFJ73DRAFT_354309 [Zopfochytrium polystomum]